MVHERRAFLAGTWRIVASLGILALPTPAAAQIPAVGPAEAVAAIYRRVLAGESRGGGQFVWLRPADRRTFFSRRTAELWDRAVATDEAAIGFDPVTNAQDPQLQRVETRLERDLPDRKTVAVTLFGPAYRGPDRIVRYDLVQEGRRWVIDNVRGNAGTQPWSVREMLQAAAAP